MTNSHIAANLNSKNNPQPAPGRPACSVLILFDEKGWAWWHRAHFIKKNMPADIQVTVLQRDLPFNHADYDFVLLFEHYLVDWVPDVPRHKIILGNSCPKIVGKTIETIEKEKCLAGFVNNAATYAQVRHRGNFFCCQNGVDTSVFYPPPQPPSQLVACWVGNSNSMGNKGLDLIKEACQQSRIPLKILDVAKRNNVFYSQEEVRDKFYHRASFYLCASEFEGTPNPALEAMACGLPVISTRVGNMPEILADGYNGFFAERSIESLQAAIETLRISDWGQMGKNARHSIEQGWTWPQQAVKYEQMFRSLAERKNAIKPDAAIGVPLAAMAPAGESPSPIVFAILTHNALASTQICLESIARNTPIPYRIVVVDNASSDETPAWLKARQDPRLHVVCSQENLGVPGGRNRLFQEILPQVAEESFLVFLDNDMELLPGWHQPYLKVFEDHPEVGIAGAVGCQITVHEEWRELWPAPEGNPAEVDVASGGFCCWIRAKAAKAIGAFDENLGKFWHEDDDYSIRAIQAGYKVFAVPEAAVIHHEHKSGVAHADLKTWGSLQNQKYLCQKWRQMGMVDEYGEIVHPNNPEYQTRVHLGKSLGRLGPVPREEYRQAVASLERLYSAEFPMEILTQEQAWFSPLFLRLIEAKLEQARQSQTPDQYSKWVKLRALCRQANLGRKAEAQLVLPAPTSKPSPTSSLFSKLCDASDWENPEWLIGVSETLREGSSQNYYRRHRITWEQGQILYGLRKILGLTPKQNILVFSHGNERLPWGLTNLVTEVILVAPDPPAWGPVPCRLEHLRRVNQQKDTLALKNQCLDGIIFLSSYHWGSKAAMIQQLCSLRPALKPGGTVAIGIEVGLNNIPHLVHFLPEEIQRLPELCQLDPVVEMQFALNEPTLNGLVEVRSNPNKRPHFIVDCHGELLSTGVLFLRKSEKPETRVGGGQTNK